VAVVSGDAERATREARRGVELHDGPVIPRRAVARPAANGRWEFEVTIAEGRNREIRRLCAALGLEIERLVRISFGPVTLDDLPSGATRPLSARERRDIDQLTAP
jgi:23S rRNA pseudouridine2605 synthase